MDYFTHVIIRKSHILLLKYRATHFPSGNELRAITGTPTPDPAIWAFSNMNDRVFSSTSKSEDKPENISPREWLHRGLGPMQSALAA